MRFRKFKVTFIIFSTMISFSCSAILITDCAWTHRKNILHYFDVVLKSPEFLFDPTEYVDMTKELFGKYNCHKIKKIYPEAFISADILLATMNSVIDTFSCEEAGADMQKLLLPPGSELIIFGDLHGSIHALVRMLSVLIQQGYLDKNLRLTRQNLFMIFLGDLTDYGRNGVDTLFTVLNLRLANPQQVFLCRGNHESIDINNAY